MKSFKAGVIYFIVVFGVGFVLGAIRLLFVFPRFGTRVADLMELPIMLVVIIVAARWTVRHCAVLPTTSTRLSMGLIALCLILLAEFILGLWLRGLSMGEYLAIRDPVSGIVQYLYFGVIVIMPLLLERRCVAHQHSRACY